VAVAHRRGIIQGRSALRSPQRRDGERCPRQNHRRPHRLGRSDLLHGTQARGPFARKLSAELADKQLVTLRIPDDYGFMDPELIGLLRAELSEYLDR